MTSAFLWQSQSCWKTDPLTEERDKDVCWRYIGDQVIVERYSVDTCLADAVLCISNTELVFSQQVGSERVFEMLTNV